MEYKLRQRLRCVDPLTVYCFENEWSPSVEHVVHTGDEYMIVEMEECESGSVYFFLAPLRSNKCDKCLSLWNDEGCMTVDKHFRKV